MGPYAMFELLPNTRFRIQAKGKMSIGSSFSFLPAVDIEADMTPSRVYINAAFSFLGVTTRIVVDMGFRGKTPYLQTFTLSMEFSKLFQAIKDGARAVLGSTLYKVADLIGLFDIFWIGTASFTISGTQVSLAVDMKIYWSIKLRLTIDFKLLTDIFNGKFLSLARSALNNLLNSLRNWSPCNCKSGALAPWENTWGPYMKPHSGHSIIPCGVTVGLRRTCGYSILCGFNVRWCSGRRRGWSHPTYPCGSSNKHCCWNLPTTSVNYCSWTFPAVGWHMAQRRRYCNTNSFCYKNLFRKWRYL